MKRLQKAILIESFCLCLLGGAAAAQWEPRAVTAEEQKGDFIKWVDFNVSYEALCAAYQWDIDTHGSEHPVSWIELLAYLAARDGDNFGKSSLKRIAETAGQLAEGSVTMEELTRDLSHYSYYKEAYTAVLGGYVGEYEIETAPGSGIYEKRYGLKAYLPLAKGFPYGDYDDFGVSRSYGYRRQHLGHDMMGQIGTPIRIIC